MPLDPQAQAYLDLQAMLGFAGYDQLPLSKARALFLARDRHTPREAVDRIEDRRIPEGPGLRIYWPRGVEAGARPGLVYFHGGGWVMGSPESSDVSCRVLANQAGAVVVSVDYSLAPEHKFPRQVEEALSAWQYTLREASSLGIDGSRIAIGGDSAGGNLAIAACLAARDRGVALPAFQLLVYPVCDHRFDTPSYREHGKGYGLTEAGMRWYWDCYLARPEDGENPYASPLRADLRGLPPAWVARVEFDPLTSEVEAFADRLEASGVAVQRKLYAGQIHGFFHLGRVMEQGRVALLDAARTLRAALADGDTWTKEPG